MVLDLSLLANIIFVYYLWLLIYLVVIGVRAFQKKPCNYKKQNGNLTSSKPKFLLLIPAHNEEMVIKDILLDVSNQNFENSYLKTLVIADNCTDDTAAIVQRIVRFNSDFASIEVYERKSSVTGKPAALNDALTYYRKFFPNYIPDCVVILDADNRVAPDFFDSLSTYVLEGHKAIQVNVKAKNPKSNIITRCCHLESLIRYRLMQTGRDEFFAPTFDGTGQCIDYKLLKEVGGFGSSKTEDFWLSKELVDRNIRIKYAHSIATWDEKPTSLIIEIKRRSRWTLGYLECLPSILISIIRRPTLMKADLLMNTTGIINGYVFWILQLLFLCNSYNLVIIKPLSFFSTIEWLIFSLATTQIFYIVVCLLEGENLIETLLMLLPLNLFFYVYCFSVLLALPLLFKRKTWFHTPHTNRSTPETILEALQEEKPTMFQNFQVKIPLSLESMEM
jgi:cellulose synthase/poly-beta-1,6-N-acetylglucosamine synthase-like glycosyltransferase